MPYTDVLDITTSGGKLCGSLGELIALATSLLADEALLDEIDPRMIARRDAEPHKWWFRGVNTNRWGLSAGLFRVNPADTVYPENIASYLQLERLIQHEYALMTRGRFPGRGENPWDRLFEMQHYGLPTRLLDWSFSLGQALYFAMQPPQHGPHEPVVWILHPRLLSRAALHEAALNDFAYLEQHGVYDEVRHWPDLPTGLPPKRAFNDPGWILDFLSTSNSKHFPVLASWTNPRIAAQMGCFTLQSGTTAAEIVSLEQYAADVRAGPERIQFLLKLRLDADPRIVEQARKQLSALGVNEYVLFPELDKVGKWMKYVRNL